MTGPQPLPKVYNSEGNSKKMISFEVVPTGNYLAAISETKWTATKDKKGKFLEIWWKLLDSEYKDSIIVIRLNLIHQNPTAIEMAEAEFNSICEACGQHNVTTTAPIMGVPCLLIVRKYDATVKGVNGATEDTPATNRIMQYKPCLQSNGFAGAPLTPTPQEFMNQFNNQPVLPPVVPQVPQAPVHPPVPPAPLGGPSAPQPWATPQTPPQAPLNPWETPPAAPQAPAAPPLPVPPPPAAAKEKMPWEV